MNLLMDTQASACFCVTQNTPTTSDLAWTTTGRNVPSELENNRAGHSFINGVCEKSSRDGFINVFFWRVIFYGPKQLQFCAVL